VPRSTAQFDSILENNFLLRQSFQEQLIMAPNLKYVYNTQAVANKRNDIYFRAGVELSGTLTYLGFAATDPNVQLFGHTDVVTDPLKIVGIPFSNYTRFDLDFRDYFDINSSNTIIGRIALGLAIPYWNSQVAPFVKQFYVGGANSIRAYPIRKVGPGSYLSYEITEEGLAVAKPEDQTGGLKLEFNTEYRFDIAGMLEGALFCDVGNVWSLKYDPDRPGSQFHFNDFYRELAVGPGFGLRLDFSYFIIRLDAAYPLVDPAVDGPKGTYYKEELGVVFPAKVLNWNFAIGYPF
jgi:outer membrane protein assembly factor BamA